MKNTTVLDYSDVLRDRILHLIYETKNTLKDERKRKTQDNTISHLYGMLNAYEIVLNILEEAQKND